MNAQKNKQGTDVYKYDVALSVAGEDRKYAAPLSSQLKRHGLSVFYYEDHQSELWGKSSAELEQVYGPQSRYVIPFISKHYIGKDWTRHEFETAKREQKKRRSEFILPIRVDDSRLFGLHDDAIHLDVRKQKIAEIAKIFLKKRHPIPRGSQAKSSRSLRSFSLGLITSDSRRMLGIVATSPLPIWTSYFASFFPEYDWKRQVSSFHRAGLMCGNAPLLRLSASVKRVVPKDGKERKALQKLWFDRLMPLKNYVDAGAFLSTHFLQRQRHRDAARVALNIERGGGLGWWNQIYLAIFRALSKQKAFHKLSPRVKIRVTNALGSCLSEVGLHRDARKTFKKLRRQSKLYKDAWGIGQSFINEGVAAFKDGKDESARVLYCRAVAHAKRHGDEMLRGRALSNLAQMLADTDLAKAERLLDESLVAKAVAKDSAGLIAGSIVRGNLAASRGDFKLAAQCYKQSLDDAGRLGFRYEHALSTYNYGSALKDLGRLGDASRSYSKARKLASRYGFKDILQMSLNALGVGAFTARRFASAHTLAEELLAVAREKKNEEYELSSLHMRAASSLAVGNKPQGLQEFRIALRAARHFRRPSWIVRCLVDATRQMTSSGLGKPNISRLYKAANTETRERNFEVAAEIWKLVAQIESNHGGIERAAWAFHAADRCFNKAPDGVEKRLENYRSWLAWAWHVGRRREALLTLRAFERFAKKTGRAADAIAAIDQRGMYLQLLGNHREAERLHRSAANAAARIHDNEQVEGSLNNLGESLRHLRRDREARAVFLKAERIARRDHRYASAISTSNNRALALVDAGKEQEAMALVSRCGREARRRRLWREYVQSGENLATLAWEMGNISESMSRYDRALRNARKYKIYDLEPRIALNFAKILRTHGKIKKAIETLEASRSRIDGFDHELDYLADLARSYTAAGQVKEATAAWNTAKRRADTLGDSSFAAYSAAELKSAIRSLATAKHSVADIRRAITAEPNVSRRADLMVQLLERLIARKANGLAQKSFDHALSFCNHHNLPRQRAQLYVRVADHEIHGTYDRKLKAFKTYVMALASILDPDLVSWRELAPQIFFKITSADSPIDNGEIKRLTADLTKFLHESMPNRNHGIRLLLWPFVMAADVFPVRNQPQRFALAIAKFTSSEGIEKYLGGRPLS